MQLEHFQIQDEVLLASLSRLRMSAIKSGSDVIGLSISDYELLFLKLFKSIISSLSIRLAESLGPSVSVVVDKIKVRRSMNPPIETCSDLNLVSANYYGWHQDSNPKYADKPMVVAWIPLENDCGITKPSISILANKKTSQTFHHDLNEWRLPSANTRAPSTADLNERFDTCNQSIVTPICNLGDIIVFDGLTFHCTSSSPDFISDRYALILRFIPTSCENSGYGKSYYRHLLVSPSASS